MPIQRIGGHDPSEAKLQFGRLVNLIAQPGSAVKIERPDLEGRFRQEEDGLYQFKVTQRNDRDTVTFSAKAGPEGLEALTYELRDMKVTPSHPVASELFYSRVIQPLHRFLFGEK